MPHLYAPAESLLPLHCPVIATARRHSVRDATQRIDALKHIAPSFNDLCPLFLGHVGGAPGENALQDHQLSQKLPS
jgi:hypothetical protein